LTRQDKGMDWNRLNQIIEILDDCGCETCREMSRGFKMAKNFADMNDIESASVALSIATEKVGMLNIPQNFLAQ